MCPSSPHLKHPLPPLESLHYGYLSFPWSLEDPPPQSPPPVASFPQDAPAAPPSTCIDVASPQPGAADSGFDASF